MKTDQTKVRILLTLHLIQSEPRSVNDIRKRVSQLTGYPMCTVKTTRDDIAAIESIYPLRITKKGKELMYSLE